MENQEVVTTIRSVNPHLSPPPTDANEILFSAEVKEDDKYVTRNVYPYILDSAEVIKLWFKLNQFPVLFASPQQTNFHNFARMLEDQYSVMLRVDDVGIILITDIVAGVEARMHISFWDSKLSGREPIIRAAVDWVLQTLRVRRVSVPVRAD